PDEGARARARVAPVHADDPSPPGGTAREALERRRLTIARRAPAGPEDDQRGVSAGAVLEGGERRRTPGELFARQLRRRAPLFGAAAGSEAEHDERRDRRTAERDDEREPQPP